MRKKEGETALLYGNSEVFRGKASPVDAPWAEAAALVYPERGTMRIGLWLHDTVQGNRMTVHYFAQKPERDTSRILAQRQVSLQLTPEFFPGEPPGHPPHGSGSGGQRRQERHMAGKRGKRRRH